MSPEHALIDVVARLTRHGVGFALVGGLAVSIRGEVRFTRDVDLAIAVDSDRDVERLTRALAAEGFTTVAIVEQDEKKRIAIARLRSPSGIVIDLLAASSGIEDEIVRGACVTTDFEDVPVASAECLLAMKVLSMRDERLQDRIDARGLLATNEIDLGEVRRLLALIDSRGFARGQALAEKLETLLQEL
jgi:acetolactate synthase regulatory subunit